ncbi:MAG: TolC family protein [Bacteroidetes bacterium]|nr:TolC family protein [Bacteroidota bacterium]
MITLKSAIDSALKNNFDIQIAKNNAEVGKMNNNFGMAGGLPSVNITAGDNESVSNIYQKLSSGTEINKDNALGNNLAAGVNASMFLFNGFKVLATKEKLKSIQTQSELLLNQQIQNTIAAIMVKYYDIIRQMGYLKIIQSSLEVSKQKLEIITQRKNVGMANDVEHLQAQIDVNAGEQNIKTQQLIIGQAKTDLLQLMSVKKYFAAEIKDTILVDKNIQMDSIINYLNRNPQYLSAEQQIKINEQIVKEVSAQRYPSVKINAGYNFNLAQSDAGQLLYNQNYGPSVGITLNIPIFNGTIYKTQRDAAVFNVNNSKLQKESLLNSLTAGTVKTYQSYSNTLQQIVSQQTSNEMAGQLVNLVIKKFQMNQATLLDVKTAQASFEDTGYQLVNLQYAAKIAEIELKRMTYRLVP